MLCERGVRGFDSGVTRNLLDVGAVAHLKRATHLPVVVDPSHAAGRADLCVLARAHLYDPYWTRHAAHELGWQLEWPDQYKTITGYNPRFV